MFFAAARRFGETSLVGQPDRFVEVRARRSALGEAIGRAASGPVATRDGRADATARPAAGCGTWAVRGAPAGRCGLRGAGAGLRNANASGTSPRRSRGSSSSRFPMARRTARRPASAALQDPDGAVLRGAVEVDQQVAAEDRRRRCAGPAGKSAANRLPCRNCTCRRTASLQAIARARRARSGDRETPDPGRETNSSRRRARRARASARALISTASMRKRSAGTPASSSAIAIEYGSSPVEQGRLSRRSDACGVRRQPVARGRCAPAPRRPRGRGRTRSPARRPLRSAPAARSATRARVPR